MPYTLAMLYFAYGANLNLRDMRRRCPQATPVSTATLSGYRLVFRLYADIVPDANGVVHGALYQLTPACVRALDAFEGEGYSKLNVKVDTVADGPRDAMAYVLGKGDVTPPQLEYFTVIARGYADWKLDPDILRRARFATLHPQKLENKVSQLIRRE